MKTATVRELRNNYINVLAWVESGEEVSISRRGKIVARLVPDRPKPQKVDWSKSAAFSLDRTRLKKLTVAEAAAVIDASRGSY